MEFVRLSIGKTRLDGELYLPSLLASRWAGSLIGMAGEYGEAHNRLLSLRSCSDSGAKCGDGLLIQSNLTSLDRGQSNDVRQRCQIGLRGPR